MRVAAANHRGLLSDGSIKIRRARELPPPGVVIEAGGDDPTANGLPPRFLSNARESGVQARLVRNVDDQRPIQRPEEEMRVRVDEAGRNRCAGQVDDARSVAD